MGFSLLSCCAPPKSAIELDDADTQAPRPVKINIVEKVSLRSRRDVSLSYLKEDNILLENKEIQAMEKESLDLSIAEEQESIFELKNEKLLEKRSRGWRQQPKSEKLAGRKDLGSKNSCPYSRSLVKIRNLWHHVCLPPFFYSSLRYIRVTYLYSYWLIELASSNLGTAESFGRAPPTGKVWQVSWS